MERSLLLLRHDSDLRRYWHMNNLQVPTIESDDASTTTMTIHDWRASINDSDDNDTDVPSQQSNDTSGMTTRSMSLPRPSGPTIRLPPEGTRSPTSNSLQSSVDSPRNEEKLGEKLMTRLRQCVFLDALPGSSLAINCGKLWRHETIRSTLRSPR